MAQQQQQQQQGSSNSNSNNNQQQGQQSSSNNSNNQEGSSSTPAQDPHFTRLQSASSILSNRINQDGRIEQATELSEVLNSSASGDYVLPHNSAWQPFTKTRTINLPDALFEEYNLLECRCYMGLFPEIERAWITVDHRLFLWDYQDGSGFTSFEEIQDIIVGVALVRPKPGVFIDSITHLLVLSTPLAVHLIGLSYIPASSSKTGKASFQLYILDLTIPTGDGRSITNIVGTSSGRIFGCSTSSSAGSSSSSSGAGELYEIIYNSKEGLFSKKCYLVNLSTGGSITGASWILPSFLRSGDSNDSNHIVQLCLDKERELLYTRTRNNTIELWNIRQGKSEKVASARDIKRQAGMLCPGTPLLNSTASSQSSTGNFEIVGMEVVNQKEGKGIGLVCITSSGVRLYFTHLRGGLRGYGGGNTQPACLELVHVRLPPNTQQQQQQQGQGQYGQSSSSNNNISITCIPNTGGGFFLAANTVTDDTDILLLFSPDIGRLATSALTGSGSGSSSNNQGGSRSSSSLVEIAGQIPIEGRTWAICESTPGQQQYPSNELKTELSSIGTKGKREFLFLTNMGMHVVQRQRPVDTLLMLLDTAPGGGRDAELAAFADSFGRDQTCAILLAILASASAVFGDRSNISTDVSNTARRAFLDIGGRAMGVQRGLQVPNGAATTNEGKVLLSGRHEGLALYFSRIVSSLMSSKIVVPATTPQNPFRVDTNLSDGILMKIQRDLGSLRSFIDNDTHLFGMIGDQWSGRSEIEASEAEQESIAGMRSLLTQTIEAISFVLLLIDYKLPEVVASCPTDLAKELVGMTYADLLTTSKGRDIARSLVSAIINMQIGQNLSVDAISDVLQQRCGSFCSADDVLLYKAIENIRKAKSGPPSERTSSLRESLRLFQKASSHLSSSKLSEVVQEYNSLRYQVGSIDLSITCSNAWDPEERGLSWWRDGSPKSDSRAPSWEPRNFCYDRILESLHSADDLLNNAIEAGGRGGISVEEADGNRSNAYARALAANEDAFHFKLYDWHMEKGLTDQLLEIRSDYLEQYLLKDPVSLERYDLLWQYYARHYQNSKAASVLATLGESNEFSLSLNKRLEYLSLAASNAKSQFPNPAMRQDIIGFLTEIEEKLEVGTVQVEVHRQVEELQDLNDQQRESMLKRLEERLFSISELYSDFAEPLELFEIMLLIFHVSDHRDEEHITRTWEALIDQIIQGAPSDAEAVQSLSGKLTSMTRRFFPSDVALPLPTIISLLEKFNMDTLTEQQNGNASSEGQSAPSGSDAWVPISLRDGGVPYELLFTIYDDLFRARIPPFSTEASASYLLPSLVSILSSWLKEVSVQGYSSSNYGAFPANEVEEAVGRYVAAMGTSDKNRDIKDKLQEIAREIRRRF